LLVDALPGATLFDLGGLQGELETLLGVRVDLLTPQPTRRRRSALKCSRKLGRYERKPPSRINLDVVRNTVQTALPELLEQMPSAPGEAEGEGP